MTRQMEIDAPPGLPFIDTSRQFDAPVDLVYRAHVEPELVRQWLGPGRYEMEIDRWEVRDGGRWRYTHRDAEGNVYGFRGVFHGAPSPAMTVQTFEFEGAPGHVALQSLILEERDGGTVVRTRSVHQSVRARDAMVAGGMRDGMEAGYLRLDELLARLAAPVA